MPPITSDSRTTNHGLNLWQHVVEGEELWQNRTDFQHIEEVLQVRDLDANRTNYTAYAGAMYVATDDPYNVYLGNGTSWEHIGSFAGGGGVGKTLVPVTTNYTAANGDVVLADTSAGDLTVTLPTEDDAVVDVKVTNAANTTTVATPGTQTIDGDAQLVLDVLHQSRTIGYDGTNYWIL